MAKLLNIIVLVGLLLGLATCVGAKSDEQIALSMTSYGAAIAVLLLRGILAVVARGNGE